MQTAAQHAFTTAHMFYAVLVGSGIGVTANKYASKIFKAMPPLPPSSSWTKQWLYAVAKSITEVEPAGKP